MRILHIMQSTVATAGGPVEAVRLQAAILRHRGVVQDIVCLDDGGGGDHLAGITVHAIGYGTAGTGLRGRINALLRYHYSPLLLGWLNEHLHEYDAAVVHGLWHYSARAAFLALRRRRVPYLVFAHGTLGKWFRRAFPLKHLVKQLLWTWNDGRLLRDAALVMFMTEDERRTARGTFLGHSAYREGVAGFGVADIAGDPLEQVRAFRQACPHLAGRRFLLFLGRIHPMKGCDLLVRAFAATAGAQADLDLVVVGPDQLGWQAGLARLADRLGVGHRIHWLGYWAASLPCKWGAFRAAEAFILPSHWESFGLAVAEALACGTPVLITDKVAIWREIDEAGAGLVGGDTEDGIVDLLRRWLALPDGERLRMGQAARACFVKCFTTDRFADAFHHLLTDITA